MRSLLGVSEKMREEHDLPGLYDQIVRIALSELQADCTSLMLWDGESDRLSVAAVAGTPRTGRDGVPAPIDGSIAGWIAKRCEPLLLDTSIAPASELHDLLRGEGLYAVAGAPLIGQGRVLGVLAAARQYSPVPFTMADRDLLALLASQVAIALETVWLRASITHAANEGQQSAHYLAQTEKLAGMGRLAASIAHEINNPLHAIYNSLHLLVNRPLSDDKRERYLGMAQEQAERLIALVQRMLNVYQPSRDGMRPTALHPILEHVLRTEGEQFERSGIVIERDWGEGLPRVMGIASHLKQVFQNLTLNAIEAMPQGGRLVVRTRAVDERFGGASQAVSVEFIDDGPGIPASEILTIFEPFYTTKSQGTGLGLPISYSIVEQHGGTLSVRSDQQRTTFRVTLPALDGSWTAVEEPPRRSV